MDKKRWKLLAQDSILQKAKGLQRRFYSNAYVELKTKAERGSFVFPPLPEVPDHILIFKPDDIGDAVQALPALIELRTHFPNTRFSLLCQKKTEPLYARTQIFDEIVSVAVKARLVRFQSFDLPAALEKFSRRDFDVAIFLRTYPVFFRQFRAVPAGIKIHPRDPRLKSESLYQSVVDLWEEPRPPQALQMLQIVSPLTEKTYSADDIRYPNFHWTDEDKSEVSQAFQGTIPEKFGVLHPFNRFETKSYPEAYWRELLSFLQTTYPFPWIVIGGKEDPSLNWSKDLVQLQGKLSLGATGYLLSKAQAFLGNESGPGHWAAALGIPTVTLMGGHSHPHEWAAQGKSLILREEVSCGPCHLRVCHSEGLRCLTQMPPQKIIPQIKGFLDARHPEVHSSK